MNQLLTVAITNAKQLPQPFPPLPGLRTANQSRRLQVPLGVDVRFRHCLGVQVGQSSFDYRRGCVFYPQAAVGQVRDPLPPLNEGVFDSGNRGTDHLA